MSDKWKTVFKVAAWCITTVIAMLGTLAALHQAGILYVPVYPAAPPTLTPDSMPSSTPEHTLSPTPKEKRETSPQDEHRNKYYDQFPNVLDFYDVIDDKDNIISRYYDTETDDHFFTWHYLVEDIYIADTYMDIYEEALLLDAYSKNEELQTTGRRSYISGDKTIRLQMWTNTASGNEIFINISINQL